MNLKHGLTANKQKPKLYQRWSTMKKRCQNPNDENYHRYGGRGIKVCERWESFENFVADMGQPPAGMSLDRIDNDGDYCKENCRWVSLIDQANNTRTNRFVSAFGKRLTVSQWARELGSSPFVIFERLKRGWPIERAVSQKVRGQS